MCTHYLDNHIHPPSIEIRRRNTRHGWGFFCRISTERGWSCYVCFQTFEHVYSWKTSPGITHCYFKTLKNTAYFAVWGVILPRCMSCVLLTFKACMVHTGFEITMRGDQQTVRTCAARILISCAVSDHIKPYRAEQNTFFQHT